MKVSFNWLKELVNVPVGPAELAERLSTSGTEVESVQPVGQDITGVVTARIESIERHPDADRLVVTQIFDGTDTHQVVTGATNVFVGAIVPLSKVGASLAGGFKIKESKLRGVPSNGMLCSETEVGVAAESNGIWILPPDTPLGLNFSEYAQLSDTILEIGILPNRGDCQSMIGVAREVAAIFKLPLKMPDIKFSDSNSKSEWTIRCEEPEFCPKYTGRGMTNVKVGPSPIWMQRRLQSGGVRPINNMVDISNYVMLECGQPMHIFDASFFEAKTVGIRFATEGEKMVTLDGVERRLPAGTGVITDGTKAVAIAGVMGGETSGVSDKTTAVLIEAAYFHPSKIRSAMRQTTLRSESSVRFEKGIDFKAIEWASDRAAGLVEALGGGQVTGARVAFVNEQHSAAQAKKIAFSAAQINGLLGSEFSEAQIADALKLLGFSVENGHAIVPTWRLLDIQEWPDLAEEVARIVGLDQIVTRLPLPNGLMPEPSPVRKLQTQLSKRLVTAGFCEIRSLPMISPEDAARCGQTPGAETTMQNAFAPEESIMAASHLPRLLNTLAYNLNRQQHDIRLFETGQVFGAQSGEIQETVELAGLIEGRETPSDYTEGLQSPQVYRYLTLKSTLESVLAPYKLTFSAGNSPQLHPIQQQQLTIGSAVIGVMGQLNPKLAGQYDVPATSLYFAINLNVLATVSVETPKFAPFSKFPSTRRDIAILAPKSLPFSDILTVIHQHKSPAVTDVFLFDFYESEKLGADKRSLAVGLVYQDLEKSLTDDDVNKPQEKLVAKLTELLPVTIR